ncbi:ABC transporter substrate-binding protein [Paenibacillus sp. 7541]|uniref:ABC transporter substrate-binding protein n=2 Tax=Paenibacillus campinasensis TaxID=66347 RepID=A0ABW9SWZ2_9BACL|nr:ABC transporter substrate-binding protein [Paenibacillus sp. 7541]MUG65499.1 ABC transporter substrate-binding protein [Paenibacillus campinasensis]PAK53941.1 ABC transporter substrate-binding protein [Paenibacillus sp. 7541]
MLNAKLNAGFKWIGAVLIMLLLLAGCGQAGDEGANPAPTDAASSGETAPSDEASASGTDAEGDPSTPSPEEANTTITDSTGASIELPGNVERVACLTEICVDSLAELGLEPVAVVPDSIAFQPEFFGDQASSFIQIGGGFMEPSLEDIAKSQPDVVIGLIGTHDMLRDGLGNIAPLYIVEVKTYEDSISFLEMMGTWTGRESEAAAAKDKFLDKMNDYKQQTPNNRSALIMYGADVNFGIDTAGSLVGSLLSELTPYPWPAPVEDGGHQAGGMAYSLEKVLETDPDHIFIETFSFGPDSQPLSEQFAANPIWSKLKAVKNNQFTEVRTAIWANGRGTRSLGIVMDEAMSTLYPDTFKGSDQ